MCLFSRFSKCVLALTIAVSFAGPRVEAVIVYRTVVLSGSHAPDTPAGAKFSSFIGIGMDTNGHIAFYGTLQMGDGGVTEGDDTGFWSEGSGSLTLVAREGSQAPDAPAGAIFGSFNFGNAIFSTSGKTLVWGTLQAGTGGVTTSNDEGTWSERFGSLALIAREGSPAPGTSEAKFDAMGSVAPPVIN